MHILEQRIQTSVLVLIAITIAVAAVLLLPISYIVRRFPSTPDTQVPAEAGPNAATAAKPESGDPDAAPTPNSNSQL